MEKRCETSPHTLWLYVILTLLISIVCEPQIPKRWLCGDCILHSGPRQPQNAAESAAKWKKDQPNLESHKNASEIQGRRCFEKALMNGKAKIWRVWEVPGNTYHILHRPWLLQNLCWLVIPFSPWQVARWAWDSVGMGIPCEFHPGIWRKFWCLESTGLSLT